MIAYEEYDCDEELVKKNKKLVHQVHQQKNKFYTINQTLMLKELRQDKTFRVYCWNALSSLVVVALVAISSFDEATKETMVVL
jgi:hypothetical protein